MYRLINCSEFLFLFHVYRENPWIHETSSRHNVSSSQQTTSLSFALPLLNFQFTTLLLVTTLRLHNKLRHYPSLLPLLNFQFATLLLVTILFLHNKLRHYPLLLPLSNFQFATLLLVTTFLHNKLRHWPSPLPLLKLPIHDTSSRSRHCISSSQLSYTTVHLHFCC